MSQDASDEHLVKLRNEEEGNPPPKPINNSSPTKKSNRNNRKRVPNQGPASKAGRISARRIGGANLQDDFQAYKTMKEQMLTKKNSMSNSASASSSAMRPASLGMKPKAKPIGAVLPKVQELGSHLARPMSNRRSSSRAGLNVNLITRSRSASNSSAVTDGTSNVKEKEIIIRYGELLKKAVVTPTWKKRFFVLTDKHLLYFLEPFDVPEDISQIESTNVPKGKIDLSMIDEVRKDKDGKIFNIYTGARTYRLKMTKSETDEDDEAFARHGASVWSAVLKGAVENAKQQHLTTAAHPRGSFSSYKVDEVDSANVSSQQFKHPAKRLIDSERYTGARPHRPANLDEYEDWTPFDVAAWLYTVHLQKYSEELYKLQVDGKKLRSVQTAADAKALGIEDDDVEDFINGIQTLRDMNQLSEANPLL